jgi:hypothetical protein
MTNLYLTPTFSELGGVPGYFGVVLDGSGKTVWEGPMCGTAACAVRDAKREIKRREAASDPAPKPHMKIYLSGPMTGLPDHNKPLFKYEASRLRALGLEVENPVDNDVNATPGAWEYTDYLRADIIQLMRCQAIAMLPDWYNSRGANLEYQIAKALGMKVYNASDLVEGRLPVELLAS